MEDDFYNKLEKLIVQAGKRDKTLLAHVQRICEAHDTVMRSYYQQIHGWSGAYALHMCQQNFVPVPCLYIELFELVIEVIFYYCIQRLPATKLICSNVHSGTAVLSASIMLLCCSLASSSFTLRKSLFLSDDPLNSRMYSAR